MDPRSRRRAGEAGLVWLTALIFSVMKEVHAADPNVTFLDDDIITYKDLEHGAFELVTKEAIPRHFLVEDPGATIVLRPQGSTIGVNQITNTATRMAELQAAQQEALATSAKGLGLTGRAHLLSAIRCRCNRSILFRLTALPDAKRAPPPVDLRLNPRDDRRTPATAAADAECGDGTDRDRHGGV
jgi:hypothetical protein